MNNKKKSEARYKDIEDALRKSEERYRLLAEHIPLHIAAIDESGKFIIWNKYSEKMFGYTQKEAIGKLSPLALHETKEDAEKVIRIATEKGIYDEEINLKHKNGKLIFVRLVVVPYRDKNGKISILYGFAEDISKRKKAENELLKTNARLKQLCLMDSHTGLYNHRYLMEIIEAEFHRARRYAYPLAVIMLDIDYFKSINDVYGHEFGDLVLKEFAKQLKKMVRRYDIVVRFGGEEFIIVCPSMDRPQALILAQRLLYALNLFNFGDKKHSIKLKLSLAVVSYPEDKIVKGMDLINLSEQTITKVKEAGGNRVYSSLDIANGEHPKLRRSKQGVDIKLLKTKIEKLNKKSNETLIEAIFAFAKTIELKDHYTGEHGENTVQYTTEIARGLDLPPEEIELVRQASMLHDLGKIGVSEKILIKKSKLTKKEFEEIKKHPQIGADIIRPIQFLHGLIPLIFYHHERWDGKGYPSGIKGDEIPVGARIIAIADVYQALTSDRPYRKAYSKQEAIKIIKDGSGTQFDPRIVDIFLKILQQE